MPVAEQPVTTDTPLVVLRAWRSYLQDTKDLAAESYHEVEPWAWDKLQQQLKKARQWEDDDAA